MTATVLPIRFADPVRLCRFCEEPIPAGRSEDVCSELCAIAVDLYLEEPPEAAELRAARANVRNIRSGK